MGISSHEETVAVSIGGHERPSPRRAGGYGLRQLQQLEYCHGQLVIHEGHGGRSKGRAGDHEVSTSTVKITGASCPSDIPSSVGQTFTCSAKLSNGGTGDILVTQTGSNSFTYTFKEGTVQIPGSTADAAIEKQLAAQGVPNAAVKCPSNIIVKVGTTVTCAVSSANGKMNGSVTFTFSNANGTVDSSSVKQTS